MSESSPASRAGLNVLGVGVLVDLLEAPSGTLREGSSGAVGGF